MKSYTTFFIVPVHTLLYYVQLSFPVSVLYVAVRTIVLSRDKGGGGWWLASGGIPLLSILVNLVLKTEISLKFVAPYRHEGYSPWPRPEGISFLSILVNLVCKSVKCISDLWHRYFFAGLILKIEGNFNQSATTGHNFMLVEIECKKSYCNIGLLNYTPFIDCPV